MNALSDFICRQIIKQTAVSKKEGKAKYKAYFVDTRIYAAYRAEVDQQLAEEGHAF